ncbi:MAG: hypothetical protein J6J43_08990 [Oscillospiraceae bacterium]|nr:hypothetical protein [Oscillospiraceae bacterium]
MTVFKKLCSLLLVMAMVLSFVPAVAAQDADVTIETGHAAEYMSDNFLSSIVLEGTGGTATGSGYSWTVVLPEDTDTTKPLAVTLTGSVCNATIAASRYFWAQGTEDVVSALNLASQNPATLSVMPEWRSGRATVIVGLGTTSKIVTSYTIKLEIEGTEPDYSYIELGETANKKYFLGSLSVSGAQVTASSVSDTGFAGASSGHKATVDITLASMPEDELTLDMTFTASGSAYIAVNGESRVSFDGTYSYTVDLNEGTSYIFTTYSTSSSSTVRGTYTVNFTVSGEDLNAAPVLSGSDTAEAVVYLPGTYTLDLSGVFTDLNGDDLTYTVSVNGEAAEQAAASYTFTPAATGTYTLVFHANDGKATSEECYTVTLTVPENTVPKIAADAVTEINAVQYEDCTLDLSKMFCDADGDSLRYYKEIAGTWIALSGSTYTCTPGQAGKMTLTFKANDSHADSEAHTVTLHVAEASPANVAAIGKTVTAGSFDFIKITDTAGNAIVPTAMELSGTTLNVTLPRSVSLSGKVRAHFGLTQNAIDGSILLPFVSAKNGTSGNTSNRAVNNIVTYGDTTLSSGKGSATVYFYDHIPGATTNTYTTYTISYAIDNCVPALTGATDKTDSVVAGSDYHVDVASLFTDADGDSLTYRVSVNGAAAVEIPAAYTYTPTVAATDVLVFTASDSMSTSESYTLTLNVSNTAVTYDVTVYVPEALSPAFYATVGYDENGVDTFTATAPLTAEAGSAVDGFTPYTVKVPETVSFISFRDPVWGGMSVPVEAGKTLYLEDFSGYIDQLHNGSYVTAQQAQFLVKDNEGHFAASGGSAVDEEADGVTYYRFLLAATGNDATYTLIAKGIGNLADIYGETVQNLFPLEPNGQNFVALELTVSNPITITVPEGCLAKLYRQINNYNTVEVACLSEKTQSGTTIYTYKNPGGYMLSWRAWDPTDESKITKAGFLEGADAVTVTWDDTDPASDVQVCYNTDTAMGMRTDASCVVNVNEQNHLVLSEGGSYRLRSFRWWQIINNDVTNLMAEPDFTYTVHTGSDVIKIVPSDGGNATGNRMDLTAVGTGTAVVEVGFDALSVSGMGYEDSPNFVYGACDPARTALVVISAGEPVIDADFGIVGAGGQTFWDAEFDTCYFVGSSGALTMTPNVTGTVSVSHDKGKSWQTLTSQSGTYTVPIVSGGNILRIETEEGTDYQVVRGDRIGVSLENLTTGKTADAPVAAGDTIRVNFEGLHHAMSKMSGVYNPGYGGGTSVIYTAYVDGTAVTSASAMVGQYLIPTSTVLTVPSDLSEGDVITLQRGYLAYSSMGSAAGAHRDITDSGLGTNTSAGNRSGASCVLPPLRLTVGSNVLKTETAPKIEKVTVAGSNMVLDNDLRVNFIVPNLPEGNTYTAYVYQDTDADTDLEIAVEQADWTVFNSANMRISVTVRAMEMTDTLTLVIKDQQGNVYNEDYATSAKTYAHKALAAASSTEEFKTLVVDMLNYGAAAQTKFSYKEDALANKDLTEAQQALATKSVACTDSRVKGANYYGSNLALEDKIDLNLFFTNMEEKDISSMYAEVSFVNFKGKTVTETVQGADFVAYGGKAGTYKIPVRTIVVADASCPVTVTVKNADGTVFGQASDSVESYAARGAATADAALYEAIMKFAVSAKAYLT